VGLWEFAQWFEILPSGFPVSHLIGLSGFPVSPVSHLIGPSFNSAIRGGVGAIGSVGATTWKQVVSLEYQKYASLKQIMSLEYQSHWFRWSHHSVGYEGNGLFVAYRR